jgi:hypothetical protein
MVGDRGRWWEIAEMVEERVRNGRRARGPARTLEEPGWELRGGGGRAGGATMALEKHTKPITRVAAVLTCPSTCERRRAPLRGGGGSKEGIATTAGAAASHRSEFPPSKSILCSSKEPSSSHRVSNPQEAARAAARGWAWQGGAPGRSAARRARGFCSWSRLPPAAPDRDFTKGRRGLR